MLIPVFRRRVKVRATAPLLLSVSYAPVVLLNVLLAVGLFLGAGVVFENSGTLAVKEAFAESSPTVQPSNGGAPTNRSVAPARKDPTVPQQPILSAYQSLDKRQGVWNNGQAALWDLNIFDHYKYFGPASRSRGYSPDQPIRFSHITHVQQNKMECQYCHWNVTKAGYAAIPEVESCMGCHGLIVGGREKWQQDEIQKIRDYYNRGEPIPWVKVHVMPAHVGFNHKRHVKAGVNCQECHGQIPNMEKVERVSSMKMGWCIDCHRDQGTSIDCMTCHK